MGNVMVATKARGSSRSKEKIREENELIILIAAEKVSFNVALFFFIII